MNCGGHRDGEEQGEAALREDLVQVLMATCPPAGNGLVQKMEAMEVNSGGNDIRVRPAPAAPHETPDFATKFLSLTIADAEPIAILLEHRLLPRLGKSLLGCKEEEDMLVPITLDLRELPLEATGIVCGVAGRLAAQAPAVKGGGGGACRTDEEDGEVSPRSTVPARGNLERKWSTESASAPGGRELVEISFLSTARAGTVIVRESDLDRALEALEDASF